MDRRDPDYTLLGRDRDSRERKGGRRKRQSIWGCEKMCCVLGPTWVRKDGAAFSNRLFRGTQTDMLYSRLWLEHTSGRKQYPSLNKRWKDRQKARPKPPLLRRILTGSEVEKQKGRRHKSAAEEEIVRAGGNERGGDRRDELEANHNFSKKAIYVILECSECFFFFCFL